VDFLTTPPPPVVDVAGGSTYRSRKERLRMRSGGGVGGLLGLLVVFV